jgi:hypothetical protein
LQQRSARRQVGVLEQHDAESPDELRREKVQDERLSRSRRADKHAGAFGTLDTTS